MSTESKPEVMTWDAEKGTISYGTQTLSVPTGYDFQTERGLRMKALTIHEKEAVALRALLEQVCLSPWVVLGDKEMRVTLSWIRKRLEIMPLPDDQLKAAADPVKAILPPLDFSDM